MRHDEDTSTLVIALLESPAALGGGEMVEARLEARRCPDADSFGGTTAQGRYFLSSQLP